jgi:hypothetical protein
MEINFADLPALGFGSSSMRSPSPRTTFTTVSGVAVARVNRHAQATTAPNDATSMVVGDPAYSVASHWLSG